MAATERSPGEAEEDPLERVAAVELPADVADLAGTYDRLLGDRDRFLWKWIHALFPEFTLSSVADEQFAHVRAQKTVLTMYVTILDDLLEQRGDHRTYREACKLPVEGVEPDPGRAAVDAETFAFVERVWRTFADGIADAPRYDEFADVFDYDRRQAETAIEYSGILSETPQLANLTGARRVEAHNMVLFAYTDVDLMYSPAFDLADFGPLRDLLWDLQEMARIGNWLTTWERELAEGDFSAGVVVLALQEGVVSPEEVRSASDHTDLVDRIRDHGIEDRFRRRWSRLYEAARSRRLDAESVDVDRLVDGMETVYRFHLATRGLK